MQQKKKKNKVLLSASFDCFLTFHAQTKLLHINNNQHNVISIILIFITVYCSCGYLFSVIQFLNTSFVLCSSTFNTKSSRGKYNREVAELLLMIIHYHPATFQKCSSCWFHCHFNQSNCEVKYISLQRKRVSLFFYDTQIVIVVFESYLYCEILKMHVHVPYTY